MENQSPTPDTLFTIAPNSWGHKKIKLKNRFGQLTEDDLHYIEGQETELVLRLRSRLGRTEAEIHQLLNAL